MNRWWLLTWTTYGTWLPGDPRGFVSSVPDESGPQRKHNAVGADYDRDHSVLFASAQSLMKEPATKLNPAQAKIILEQFHTTADHRGWRLIAAAILWNHIHLVVGVPGDPDPANLLRDFKSYASRALNRSSVEFRRERWWTESGSRCKLPCETAVFAAVRYVRDQHEPLVVWIEPAFAAENLIETK